MDRLTRMIQAAQGMGMASGPPGAVSLAVLLNPYCRLSLNMPGSLVHSR